VGKQAEIRSAAKQNPQGKPQGLLGDEKIEPTSARAATRQAVRKHKMRRFGTGRQNAKDLPLQYERIAQAQKFTRFAGGDARVGGQAVVVVEAGFGRPRRNMRAAVIAEDFLEAGDDFSGARVARRHRAARAGIAALELDFADAEAHGAAFFFAEELILPERGYPFDLERGAETLARFVELHAAK
jgi:hypothetical protein